jgi:hypothetical protein
MQGRSTGALVLLLQKELNPSGVSSLGRIVLPKVDLPLHILPSVTFCTIMLDISLCGYLFMMCCMHH